MLLAEEVKEECCQNENCVTCKDKKPPEQPKVFAPENVNSILWEGMNALYQGLGIKNYTKFVLELRKFVEEGR